MSYGMGFAPLGKFGVTLRVLDVPEGENGPEALGDLGDRGHSSVPGVSLGECLIVYP